MADVVLETVPLGFQWPTLDPFLFCVHHLDAYPAGTPELGPDPSLLTGRELGMDFEPRDGWRMYHGQTIPGFPQHPHRGFETVTYARQGFIDHSDSLGAAARFGRGDVQWMTAGRGIVHSEMFPMLNRAEPNTTELFQIWLNLPASDKLVEPHFAMLWDHAIPRLVNNDDDGRRSEVTVIAGRLGDLTPPPPPPRSWAARTDNDVTIWHITMDGGARFTVPAAHHPNSARMLYLFDGGGLEVSGMTLGERTGAAVDAAAPLVLVATDGPIEVLVLGGRPIVEPVAQYGPFVMNTRAEIETAYRDYQATGFGGWPWPDVGPVHGTDPARFARHADERLEYAEVAHGG
ncbi:MAG TPA: pirin family protein [Acidimicrobiales bacterium]